MLVYIKLDEILCYNSNIISRLDMSLIRSRYNIDEIPTRFCEGFPVFRRGWGLDKLRVLWYARLGCNKNGHL